jgi:succinate dehydrogenase/fumarate reductase-like Fe-S protein
METKLTINGLRHRLDADPRTTLLDALRHHLGLTGTKKGCDHGQCGACTVLIDGRRINACLTLACMHDGQEIVTIEGLGEPDALSPQTVDGEFGVHCRSAVAPYRLHAQRAVAGSVPAVRDTSPRRSAQSLDAIGLVWEDRGDQ